MPVQSARNPPTGKAELASKWRYIEESLMPNVVSFYMDDSGTRHPDHNPGRRAAHGYDWFALGGILVKGEDEAEVRRLKWTPFAGPRGLGLKV
jgi:hypothetical protein